MELNPAYVKFARALRDFFGTQENQGDFTILIWAPILFLLIYLFLSMAGQTSKKKRPIQPKDLEFFDLVLSQKGLEEFDRELLLEMAETFNISPVYRLILEEDLFRKLLMKLKDSPPDQSEIRKHLSTKIDYLRKLQGKIFLAGS
jgi:hypothetical protein